MVYLVADYVSPGLVLYWLEPSEYGLIVLGLGASLPLIVPNKRLVKPEGWFPGEPAYQPVRVVDIVMFCGYALVFVGGVVIFVTIAENFATFGAGIFDDAATIPGGLLLIDIGQRLAVPIETIDR